MKRGTRFAAKALSFHRIPYFTELLPLRSSCAGYGQIVVHGQFGTSLYALIATLTFFTFLGFRVSTRSMRRLVVVVFFLSVRLSAQTSSLGSSAFDLEKMLGASQGKSAIEAAQRSDQTPADNVIQPKYYHVGPGDVLSFLKLDANAIEESIVVSPENMLFIPRLGALSVAGKTLEQVRDTIVLIQRQRTPGIAAFVGLRRARQVYVSIRGNVLSPGMYVLPASLRISTALKLAMQFRTAPTDASTLRVGAQALGQADGATELGSLRQRTSVLPTSVLRNISVHHADRTTQICDLQRAELSDSADDDPYVREGDEIFIPNDVQLTATMSIAGGVSQPTTTMFKPGDKISFLLKLGGHCTNLSSAPRATLVRENAKTELAIDEQLNLKSADMDALAGDVIIVDQDMPAKASRFGAVLVRGEVARQGAIAIEQNVTRVKDVLEQSGGCTSDAYLPMAYILRRERNDVPLLHNEYVERLKKLQYSNLILEDTVRFTIDELARRPLVSCDISKALSNPSGPDNVVLQDGDMIVVPRNPRSVFVYGQVKNGGYFEYKPGRSLEDYIAMAGGMTAEADKGRERIIKGKTGVWLKNEEAIIEAGDRIYVPHPPDEPLGQQVQKMASYVQIGSAIVGVIMTSINIYLTLKK